MAGRFKRFISQAADALFIPGNAYNSTTGRWNPATTKLGIAGLIADQFVPGGSNIVGVAGRSGLLGSDFAGALKNEGIYNTLADQYGDFREGLQNDLRNTPIDVGGANPQVSVGNPQSVSIGNYAPTPQIPTMPSVQAQGPWTGLGTSSGGLFSGGSLGNWANGNTQPQGRSFGQAAGSFTPWGAGVIQNDYWGGAAGGFGIGATNSGSGGSYALADAMAANKKNRD
jgi:hypothetical protein